MMTRDHLELATRSLRRNPLRTILTMLGILIGVASVIAMISIGMGARSVIEAEIARLGSRLVMVLPNAATRDGVTSGLGARNTLTEADAKALAAEVYGIEIAVPGLTGNVQAVLGNANWNTRLVGTMPSYANARDWQIENGRNFTVGEVESSAKVAVVGRTVASRLAPGLPILGAVVRIGRVPFRIVGVLSVKGFSMGGTDQDDIFLVPITTAKSRLIGNYQQSNRDAVEFILVKAASSARVGDMQLSVTQVLRARHGIGPGQGEDFVVRDPSATLAAQRDASGALTLFLACIAAISLLVGGISVMNIMLVSVAERRQEIGIRLAVGAAQRDIRNQFLWEASFVALAGGLAGAAVGILASVAIRLATGWPIIIELQYVLATIALSGAVGIASGYYPAAHAAKLDPVEALSRD